MADTQALNATFFAFSKRETGGVLIGASVGFALGMLVLLVLVGAAVWALLGPGFFSWYGDMMATLGKGDPNAAASMSPPPGIFYIFPIEIVFLVLYFILQAAYEAACLRWMIKGERTGFLGLSLGADTWRVYGTYWAWFVFFFIGVIVAAIIFGVAGAALGAVLGENAWAAGLALGLLCIAALIYIPVRMAPAAATSVGIGKFAFFSAWQVSRGRFWALFGAFLLLWVMYVVIIMVAELAFFGIMFGHAFANIDWANVAQNPEALSQAYMEGLAGMFSNPVSIAIYVLFVIAASVFAFTFYVLLFGVNARAVQAALAEGKLKAAA